MTPDKISASPLPIGPNKERLMEAKKKEMAFEFERIFAMHMVQELTKESFKMSDNNGNSDSSSLHRHHVTETLANELARSGKLGMTELVLKNWKVDL